MLRAVLGVIAGYAVWTVIWLVGNALLFADLGRTIAEGEPYEAAGPYAGVLVLSMVCSLAGGLTCGLIARRKAFGSALVLSGLLLLTGIGVQASVWSLEPVWFHLCFLILLVPVTLVGAGIAPRGRA